MSRRLPRITADQAIRILHRLGFVLVRQSGSHKIFRNAAGVRVTLPYHAGKTLHPKLVKSILRDTDLSIDSFIELL